MMDKKCAICGTPKDLFELILQPEELDADVPITKYVCGSCWEVIAAIARRAIASLLIVRKGGGQ